MDRLKVLVSGMVAADPHQGGATWAVLQYLIGLRALGHAVSFVEPISREKLKPGGASLAESTNARYFDAVIEHYSLSDHGAALLVAGSQKTHGCTYKKLRKIAAEADLLINISGLLTDEALLGAIERRVYLDMDPAFNQLWHAVDGIDMRFGAHTHFVTIGQAIGQPGCDVPECWASLDHDPATGRLVGVAGDAR